MALTHEDIIETAIGWARQFRDIGVPDDITAADAVIHERRVQHSAKESGTGTLTWQGTEWTVLIRRQWVVELNEISVPKGPPRRIRGI